MPMLRICVALSLLAFVSAAAAGDYRQGDIAIGQPWARATPGGATVGAGYLTITNNGKSADRLTGVTLDGAKTVEIHEMTMSGDTMKMRRVSGGLTIKPGATLDFAPGSYHLMFRELSKPLVQGSDVKGTLTFEKAGTVAVDFKVEGMGAMGPAQDHSDMTHMDHHH